MVYLTACAYYLTEHVMSQLDIVHRVALGLNNWQLAMSFLGNRARKQSPTVAPLYVHTFEIALQMYPAYTNAMKAWLCTHCVYSPRPICPRPPIRFRQRNS